MGRLATVRDAGLMKVFRAKHDDSVAIAQLGEQFVNEFMPGMPYNGMSFGCVVQNWIQNNPMVSIWVLKTSDGEVIGFSIGMLSAPWFNPQASVFSELAWFVREDYRSKTGTGSVRLLTALRDDAEAMGATHFSASAEADSKSLVTKLYSRMGMTHQESTYVMPINQGNA